MGRELQGKRVPAAQVRKELKLADYHPFGMDGISILSNSNVAEAQSVASVKKLNTIWSNLARS